MLVSMGNDLVPATDPPAAAQTPETLADVVGSGPNPRECVDLVMTCKLVLLGNHDQGAMFDPEGFNPPAERAIFWTRAQLEATASSREDRERRWEFLSERPRTFRENG